jgi:hypothetical protein
MQAEVTHFTVLTPTLFNMYMNDAPQTNDPHLAFFVVDTCLYVTDHEERFVVRKLQRCLSSVETWWERWNIKINEHNTRGIYFTSSRRPPESHLTLYEPDISFVNSKKYVGVLCDRKVTWRWRTEMIEAKGSRTFIRIYSLFESARLSSNIKLTLHKALIRSVVTYMLVPLGVLRQKPI